MQNETMPKYGYPRDYVAALFAIAATLSFAYAWWAQSLLIASGSAAAMIVALVLTHWSRPPLLRAGIVLLAAVIVATIFYCGAIFWFALPYDKQWIAAIFAGVLGAAIIETWCPTRKAR